MSATLRKLKSSEVNLLKSMFRPLKFSRTFNLVYEDQIPHTGILFLNGEANLTRKNKIIENIDHGVIWGIEQLLHNVPSKFGLQIIRDSEVILIPKSALLEAIKDENSFFYQFFHLS